MSAENDLPIKDSSKAEERYTKSFEINEKFHKLVPAGSHTYSKGEDQQPYLSPRLVSHAKGAKCWDVDGNEYTDWMMGNRTFILGHAYDVVDDAVKQQIDKGTNFSRPGILEYELAEYLVDLWPVAEMVKFGKNGSDVTHAAIKLARAYTGKDHVARCSDQPFFGTHDWFISSTPCNNGIPKETQNYTLGFRYNDIESLEALFDAHPNKIACVIMEPVKTEPPKEGFLEQVKAVCEKNNALLIFDEMISGIRFDIRGAHHKWGVYPHLAAFGKCISNGYSCSVLAGQREFMRLGGIHHDQKRTFLLSQTHASETVGLAATLATLQECHKIDVSSYLEAFGRKFKESFNKLSDEYGLSNYIQMTGFNCNPNLSFIRDDGTRWMELMTLFIQECLSRGVMISWLTLTYSHKEEHMNHALRVFDEVFSVIKPYVENDEVEKFLVGPAIKPVMRPYNK